MSANFLLIEVHPGPKWSHERERDPLKPTWVRHCTAVRKATVGGCRRRGNVLRSKKQFGILPSKVTGVQSFGDSLTESCSNSWRKEKDKFILQVKRAI